MRSLEAAGHAVKLYALVQAIITGGNCHDEGGSFQYHSTVLSHSDEDGHEYLSQGQRHHKGYSPGFFKETLEPFVVPKVLILLLKVKYLSPHCPN